MKKILLSVLCLTMGAVIASAQIEYDWVRQYDHDGCEDFFHDVFAVSSGGYVTCGQTDSLVWITRLSDEGEVTWTRSYGNRGTVYDAVWTVIESDSGEFLVGMTRDENFSALLVESDGTTVWWNDYGAGICHALIELKNGDFLLVGHGNGRVDRAGQVIKVNRDGEVIWREVFDPGFCDLYSVREVGGGVVATGTKRNMPNGWYETLKTCLVKFDADGEVSWFRYFDFEMGSIGRGIVSTPDNGFAIVGYVGIDWDFWPNDGQIFLIKTDENGAEEWTRKYGLDPWAYRESAWSIFRPRQGGFVIVGDRVMERDRSKYLKILRTTDEGLPRWSRLIQSEGGRPIVDVKLFSVIEAHDSTIIAAGAIDNEDVPPGYNGVLVKFGMEQEPGRLQIRAFPEARLVKILPNHSIDFRVEVLGEPEGEVNFYWQLDGEGVSNANEFHFNADENRNYHVACFVADEASEASIEWSVMVDSLYIVSASPVENPITIRRRTSVAFSIDSVATLFDRNSLEFYWTLANLGDPRPLIVGQERQKLHAFDVAGRYGFEGLVAHGDRSDAVYWEIDVRGLIKSYQPESTTISVEPHRELPLTIIPLSYSPSNRYSWFLDGTPAQSGVDSTFRVVFDTTSHHLITGILSDSLDSDTVEWRVTVSLDVPEDDAVNPGDFFLSTYPNPFNSQLTITVGLETGATRLTIHDLQGRVVAELDPPFDSPPASKGGKKSVVWDATGVAAGIYVVRLESAGRVEARKVVLVR